MKIIINTTLFKILSLVKKERKTDYFFYFTAMLYPSAMRRFDETILFFVPKFMSLLLCPGFSETEREGIFLIIQTQLKKILLYNVRYA